VDVAGAERVDRDVTPPSYRHVQAKIAVLLSVRRQVGYHACEDPEERPQFERPVHVASDVKTGPGGQREASPEACTYEHAARPAGIEGDGCRGALSSDPQHHRLSRGKH